MFLVRSTIDLLVGTAGYFWTLFPKNRFKAGQFGVVGVHIIKFLLSAALIFVSVQEVKFGPYLQAIVSTLDGLVRLESLTN